MVDGAASLRLELGEWLEAPPRRRWRIVRNVVDDETDVVDAKAVRPGAPLLVEVFPSSKLLPGTDRPRVFATAGRRAQVKVLRVPAGRCIGIVGEEVDVGEAMMAHRIDLDHLLIPRVALGAPSGGRGDTFPGSAEISRRLDAGRKLTRDRRRVTSAVTLSPLNPAKSLS